MTLKIILAVVIVISVFVLGSFIATALATSTPSWAKFLGTFWSDGQISDSEFLEAIQFLVNEDIIQVKQKIVEVEVIREVQAQPLPTNTGVVWEAIGALQERDDKLQWDINNQMIGPIQYDELGQSTDC